MYYFRLILIFLSFIGVSVSSSAQTQTEWFCVSEIQVSGVRKTKVSYILRELDFKEGDTILLYDWVARKEQNEKRLLNTDLFFSVEILDSLSEGSTGKVFIYVKESGRLSFSPGIELADRNFNVWWEEKDHLLDRLNFRLATSFANLRGRNDYLKLTLQVGYTQKAELQYILPFVNKLQKVGLGFGVLATRNKEIYYATRENRQLFQVFENEFLLHRFRAQAFFYYRQHLYWTHTIQLEWNHYQIKPYVRDQLNYNYLGGTLRQRFDAIQYSLTFDNRNMIPYPESGNYWRGSLIKQGVIQTSGLDASYLSTEWRHYHLLSDKWSLANIIHGRAGIQRKELPYNNIRAIGFDETYIRGYDVYLIDGLDFVYTKNSLRFKIQDRKINFGKWMPLTNWKVMPIRIYLVGNLDLGYVNNPFNFLNNDFANKLLVGGGLGIDFVAYYSKVVRIELSTNHLLEPGIFLHYKFGIK